MVGATAEAVSANFARMKFEILHSDTHTKARTGRLYTAHGIVDTPVFMPVGTRGSVKHVPFEWIESLDYAIILANTYHLYLRPGHERIREAGGIHRFMGWHGAVLTDSGGFQIYSLGAETRICDDGVFFRSVIDGSTHHFTPQSAIDVQMQIGADIIMAFDECIGYPAPIEYVREATERTHRWLDQCWEYFHLTPPYHPYPQILVPIVQGGMEPDLRRSSAEYVIRYASPIYAIGGLSVGESAALMYAMTDLCTDILPPTSARYLMGVGTPANILEAIARGIDMFDCVLPTRNARHGLLYTWQGMLQIKNRKWESDDRPIDSESPVPSSRRYSRAYLRHLFKSGEPLGPMLASIHNLGFFSELLRRAREHIALGDFSEWKAQVLPQISKKI